MAYNYDTLPQGLKDTGRFCCWNLEERDGKKTKVPYNPNNGKKGDSANPDKFADYEHTVKVSGNYSGIGIGIFNGVAGVDIDHCIENGQLNQTAQAIISILKTYCEYSPSGTGLHFYGKVRPDYVYDKKRYYIKNPHKDVEVYVSGCTNRFLTVTGNRYPGNEYGLEDITDMLPELLEQFMQRKSKKNETAKPSNPINMDDTELIEKIKNSHQGMKFIRLWSGDISGYPSHSEADQALCNILAFWTGGDFAWIDRLFQQSGLYRKEKWSREDYRNSTIQKAITSCDSFYNPEQYKQPDDTSDDLAQFHHFNAHGFPTGVYDYEIFRFITEGMNIMILGGVPYIYNHGVYKPDQNGSRLKTVIRRLIYPQLIKSTTIDRVYKLFLSDAGLQVDASHLNQYPPHWINFKNGFYDPVEKRMIPHDPKYKAVNQIPHEYKPEAVLSGKNIDEWLEFITPGSEDREMILQFLGYCLTKDTRQQKFIILVGVGGTGKSTVIKMIESVVGIENISNISLKEFTGNRFASYGLVGKLINTCADLEISALEDTSLIKKILGEDTLRAEAKGKDAISFRNYAKLIFSTNELPLVLSEKTNGFFRRLLVLTMNREPKIRKVNYLETLQKEIDYFIMLIVRALERMYESGKITESPGSQQAVMNLWYESDTVKGWLADNCQTEFRPDEHWSSGKTERTKLYSNYVKWCVENGRKELTPQNFYKSLRLKNFEEKKTGGLRFFVGIDFTKDTWDKIKEEEQREKTQGRRIFF